MAQYRLSDLYCVVWYMQNSASIEVPDEIFTTKEEAEAHADKLNSGRIKLPFTKDKNPYCVERLDKIV